MLSPQRIPCVVAVVVVGTDTAAIHSVAITTTSKDTAAISIGTTLAVTTIDDTSTTTTTSAIDATTTILTTITATVDTTDTAATITIAIDITSHVALAINTVSNGCVAEAVTQPGSVVRLALLARRTPLTHEVASEHLCRHGVVGGSADAKSGQKRGKLSNSSNAFCSVG